MNARDIVAQLKSVKKSGAGWTARCPAHDDKHNSLSVSDGTDGRLLLHCHAGCEFEAILAAIPQTNGNGNGSNARHEVAAYDYRDQSGSLLYQAVRFEPKDFRVRRPDGNGGFLWNLNGGPRVLYRLPEVLTAKPNQTILILEGEKDCDRVASLGLVATTNVAGAGKWRDDYSEALRGRKVCILPDNDEPGRKHAQQVAASLLGIAESVKVIDLPGLPEKGDVSNWLDAGGTVSELRKLVNNAGPFVGPSESGSKQQKPSLTTFSFTTLDDLLAEPKEEINCVVERMLPCGGFSIVAAKPKIGKSTLARNLAVCISIGAPFFARATKQGKVLYLCLEEKRTEVADHFRRMGASGSSIIIHTGATPQDVITALNDAIEAHSPGLVIIDPLSRFIRVADFSSYGDVTIALEPLIDLARNSKCQTHIMALHHNGKSGDLRENGDALLGSTAFFGMVDTLITMRKREKVRTVESTQRYGEDLPETIVHLDPITGVVDAAGDMKEFSLNERKKAVLESIGTDPQSVAAIKELVGGTNAGLTSKAVLSLFEEGKLTRSGKGKKGDPFLYQTAGAKTETTDDDLGDLYFPPGASDEEMETIYAGSGR